jgi:predicted transcriptional regulator
MKVLLSIKPNFAEDIFEGHKKYEFRKSIFKSRYIEKVLLYATQPIGKIVGEFFIDEILQDNPETLWNITHDSAGISKEYFNEYFSGRSKGYAIKIKNAKKYDNSIDIGEISDHLRAPQSFAYVP